ncbi:MAG: KaiC family ATPase implicated in signal transduction [Candidatus Methanohalarchaeum thermophilum]|uniref:KaiC family ATPase implicated in signal transduction n=1 Tax=Methanohalarchaeum thermophilum TaxID=1903181 RepID=A0A1Q6DW11_METT1|nr:MAG: KaiC family ATPase implicated in signal transduction [Candidatus Methanohalarchaeum thermophilum]
MKKFGIEELDGLLRDGFLDSSTIVIVGSPSSRKELFSFSFVEEGVRSNESSLFFTLGRSIDRVTKGFKRRGINIEDIEVIDGYSWRLNESLDEERLNLKGPNLNEFLHLYNKSRCRLGDGGRTVIDSFNSIANFAEPNVINNVLQLLMAEEKSKNNLTLLTVEKSLSSEKLSFVQSTASTLIETLFLEGKKFLKICWHDAGSFDSRWHNYEIERGVSESSPHRIRVDKPIGDSELKNRLDRRSIMDS